MFVCWTVERKTKQFSYEFNSVWLVSSEKKTGYEKWSERFTGYDFPQNIKFITQRLYLAAFPFHSSDGSKPEERNPPGPLEVDKRFIAKGNLRTRQIPNVFPTRNLNRSIFCILYNFEE